MRQLDKIIFINSAHIPYKEIKVDGNVHFVGTQGVGKSTVLRALLFFYNADKQKLGISSEKRPFDEFYFPAQNSYLIYQVQGKNGKFFVVAYSWKNRVCFRFADTEYRMDFFVSPDGKVLEDWTVLRKKLLQYNAILTKQVDSYEMYKNIIYGNKSQIDNREFYRFSILESPKYQNVPRTIQNVFLNTKLDGEFIKSTIISSMYEDVLPINLDFYRQNIADFAKQYRDIEKWYEKDSNGKVKVKVAADIVIMHYNDLIILGNALLQSIQKLNYVYDNCLNNIPIFENQLLELESKKNELSALYGEEEKKYTQERDTINKAIGINDDKLKSCKKKREEYRINNIESIISMIENEPVFLTKLQNLKDSLNAIKSKFKSVDEKYNLLIQKEKQNYNEVCNSNAKILSVFKEEKNKEIEKILNEKNAQLETLRQNFDAEKNKINNNKDVVNQKINELKIERVRIAAKHYFETEIEKSENEIKQLEKSLLEFNNQKTEFQAKADKLRLSFELFSISANSDAEKECSKYNTEIREINQKISELDAMLEKSKGSFCEWLDNNCEGWENTIGKIADENTVLYNTNLNPIKSDNSGNLFGVEINLENIETDVRRPEDLRNEKCRLENKLNETQIEIRKIKEAAQEKIAAENKKISSQISKIQIDIRNAETQITYIPHLIEVRTAERDNLLRKEDEKRTNDIAQIDAEIKKYDAVLEKIDAAAKDVEINYNRDKGVFNKKFANKKAEIEVAIKKKENEVRQQNESLQKESDSRICDLENARTLELKNDGADTQVIEKMDIEIRILSQKISEINGSRETYYQYQRDKADLFDKEEDMLATKADLAKRIAELNEKYRLRREKLQMRKNENEKKIAETDAFVKDCKTGKDEIDKFRVSDIFPQQFADNQKLETTDNWNQVLEEIKNAVLRKMTLTEKLKKSVNTFNTFFECTDTFSFKLSGNEDESFLKFASDLKDFVNENRIEIYRRQINVNYSELILRISKETGDLLKYSGKISKVINAINDDFENNKFSGVIKEIKLRHKPSDNGLMMILTHIQTFCNENSFNLEEQNLFSQGGKNEVHVNELNLLFSLSKLLQKESDKKELTVSDTFQLEFSITENDHNTGWKERISTVGSDGTDILVKAMINIMLINVFKEKVSKKSGDFCLHCMMDEIGKLHPSNVAGILNFANSRNIYLINSSPMTYNISDYKYTYFLEKDQKSNTVIKLLVAKNENNSIKNA